MPLQGRYQDKEELISEEVKDRHLTLGDTHPPTLESRHNLIELYEAWGKQEKVEEWRTKLPKTKAAEQR
jgi:hypothetical protein